MRIRGSVLSLLLDFAVVQAGVVAGHSGPAARLPAPPTGQSDSTVSPQLFGLHRRATFGRFRQDDGEFVTAIAGSNILGPQTECHIRTPTFTLEEVGKAGQQLIPRQVAIGIIDRFEVVEIDKEQGELQLMPLAPGYLAGEGLLEIGVIEQLG